jgi:EAL domain-containing protein (putative c-di-GMP-specific phosphodiesterase class I)
MVTEQRHEVEPEAGFELAPILADLEIHLQPIIDVSDGAVWAFEALARFPSSPPRPVDEAIEAAHLAGFGHGLELACVRAALARRDQLPENVRIAINVSPDVLANPHAADFWDRDFTGVIVEVTEHRAADPNALRERLTMLRERGALIAVDDVGTGYAGLLRLATTHPDLVKLDRTVVTGARDSEEQRAVLEALVTLSHRLGAAVVGEGVETLADLSTLAAFDVNYGQGWAIGRPAPRIKSVRPEVVDSCLRARAEVLRQRAATAATEHTAHGMHTVAEALGRAGELASLHAAIAQAAGELQVDAISASIVDAQGSLREITSTGAAIDTSPYALADYPATKSVIETGASLQVHVGDPDADPAESDLLRRLGLSGLLMLPLGVGEERFGVLELLREDDRRWTSAEVAHAGGLATHVATALLRVMT